MVSEYKDSEQTRLAWATLSETLMSYHSELQLWPQAYGPHELELYLRRVIMKCEQVTLLHRDVKLEQVYVSLRAEEMNPTEWEAEHHLYLDDVAAIQRAGRAASVADQYAEFSLIRKAITRHPKVLKLTTRDWSKLFRQEEPGARVCSSHWTISSSDMHMS